MTVDRIRFNNATSLNIALLMKSFEIASVHHLSFLCEKCIYQLLFVRYLKDVDQIYVSLTDVLILFLRLCNFTTGKIK